MKHITRQVWLTALIMVCGWLLTNWVRAGYSFEVTQMKSELASLPMVFLGYQGTDIDIDDEISKVLAADSTLNREYTQGNGTSITIHGSAWIHPEAIASVAPHPPSVCYVNAGWTPKEERMIDLKTTFGTIPIKLIAFQKGGMNCVVGYWYQMGEHYFTTSTEARKIHRVLWGQKKWPFSIKFMLQIQAQEIDKAIPELEPFAIELLEWSRNL